MLLQLKMQLPFFTQFYPQVGIEQFYSIQPGVSTIAPERIVTHSGPKNF